MLGFHRVLLKASPRGRKVGRVFPKTTRLPCVMPQTVYRADSTRSAQRRKGAKSAKKTFAFLPCLAFFAPWRSWRASEAKRTFGGMDMEPGRCASLHAVAEKGNE